MNEPIPEAVTCVEKIADAVLLSRFRSDRAEQLISTAMEEYAKRVTDYGFSHRELEKRTAERDQLQQQLADLQLERDGWKKDFDVILKRWRDRAEKAEKELDDWQFMADAATTHVDCLQKDMATLYADVKPLLEYLIQDPDIAVLRGFPNNFIDTFLSAHPEFTAQSSSASGKTASERTE